MKKKIFSFLIVMLMLISITPYAFASGNVVPPLPDGTKENWVITQAGGYYFAINYENISQDADGKLWINDIVRYTLANGKWVYHFTAGAVGVSNVLYDSQGILATASKQIFGIIDSSAFSDYYDGLKGQINVQNIVQIIVVGAGACVGLVFLYWGCRKGVKALMSAFKKGRVSL